MVNEKQPKDKRVVTVIWQSVLFLITVYLLMQFCSFMLLVIAQIPEVFNEKLFETLVWIVTVLLLALFSMARPLNEMFRRLWIFGYIKRNKESLFLYHSKTELYRFDSPYCMPKRYEVFWKLFFFFFYYSMVILFVIMMVPYFWQETPTGVALILLVAELILFVGALIGISGWILSDPLFTEKKPESVRKGFLFLLIAYIVVTLLDYVFGNTFAQEESTIVFVLGILSELLVVYALYNYSHAKNPIWHEHMEKERAKKL